MINHTVYTAAVPDLTTSYMQVFNAQNDPLLLKLDVRSTDGRRNKVYYNAFYADANLDGSCENNGTPYCDFSHLPTINYYGFFGDPGPDESEGYELPDPDYKKNVVVWLGSHVNVGQYMYRNLFLYLRAGVVCSYGLVGGPCVTSIIKNYDNTTPQLNDFNVTEKSAQHPPGFKTIGGFFYNHTRLNNDYAGQAVLQTIIQQQH